MNTKKLNVAVNVFFTFAFAGMFLLGLSGYTKEAEEPKPETVEIVVTEATRETEPPEVPTENPTEEPTEVPTEEPTEEPELVYSEAELEWMAMVIYQEAGGDACSDETRLMVGTVVMNRVEDPRFPDTIYDVLMQEQQYGLFYWTGLKWPERASNPGERHAVDRAYECARQILDGYRSFDKDVIWQAEFRQGTEVVAYQDGMYFCK